MSGCRMFEYGGDGVYEIRWNGDWYVYMVEYWLSSEDTKEGVLYRGTCGNAFFTPHNGKLICLRLQLPLDWTLLHQQLHDLIEIEGLTPYDAFKVMVL